MKNKIHYIGNEQNSKFIIAETKCGKHWNDINDFTSVTKYVTCSKCLKLISDKKI